MGRDTVTETELRVELDSDEMCVCGGQPERQGRRSSAAGSIALDSPAIVCVCVKRGGGSNRFTGNIQPDIRRRICFRSRKGERACRCIRRAGMHEHE
jgi:hypothetical protein